MAVVSGGRRIHFGALGYKQFRDRIGSFSHLDHGDPKRRRRFLLRHTRIGKTNAALKNELKRSGGRLNARILSIRYLW